MTDYTKLFEKQKTFYKSGASRSISFRKEQLRKLYKMISLNEKKINEALWKDLHKSPYESYLTEVGICLEEIKYLIRNLRKFARKKRVRTLCLCSKISV